MKLGNWLINKLKITFSTGRTGMVYGAEITLGSIREYVMLKAEEANMVDIYARSLLEKKREI